MRIPIHVGPGELVDRIAILGLKREHMRDSAARARAGAELAELEAALAAWVPRSEALEQLAVELHGVNAELWRVEDAVRACEDARDFGPTFVELARTIYRLNDERAGLKRRINALLGSPAVEEKVYASR